MDVDDAVDEGKVLGVHGGEDEEIHGDDQQADRVFDGVVLGKK